MGARSLNYTQTSKVKSLHGWTGHQSKVTFVWKNLLWNSSVRNIGPLVSPWHLRFSPRPWWFLRFTPDPWCGTSEAGTTPAAFAGAQGLVRVGVSSNSPWGFAKVESLVEFCFHWVLLSFYQKWQMQTSAGTPKCCLPREHLGLRCESKFAEELRTSGCWEQGWRWRREDVSNTGVKNTFCFIFRRPF